MKGRDKQLQNKISYGVMFAGMMVMFIGGSARSDVSGFIWFFVGLAVMKAGYILGYEKRK